MYDFTSHDACICANCNRSFLIDDVVTKRSPEGEEYGVCPSCGYDDLLEANTCAECEEIALCEDIHEGLCIDCANAIRASVRSALANAFFESEWPTIQALMEGEELFPKAVAANG